MEQDLKYTVHIKFQFAGNDLPGILMHFERLEDAVDRFLMVYGHHFITGFGTHPFEKLNVSEATITSDQDGKVLISSGVELPAMGSGSELAPGFYFRFPEGVSAFEKTSGISFVDFKAYEPSARTLMVAGRLASGYQLFRPTIGYENMKEQAREKLQKNQLYGIALQRYFFDVNGVYVGNLQPYPSREDYVFDSPDKALHKLLQTDFNALDDSVAWENGLQGHIKKAVLYRTSPSLKLEYRTLASLHSARRNWINIGTKTVREPGIYLELDYGAKAWGFSFPFSGLEQVKGQDGFLVGRYNDALSRTEKISGLLDHFEKKQQKIARVQRKNSQTRRSKGRRTGL